MLTRPQISAFLALSLALWIGFLVISGEPLSWSMLAPFGTVVGGVSFILLMFDIWAWKWPIFQGWLIKRPMLHGTWRTELQSDWIDPKTGETVPLINCFVVIRQTASNISLRMVTPESRSETVSAGIEAHSDGTFEVSCAYRNKPKAKFRDRSEVHYGAMLLGVENAKPLRVEGEYWTDRKTTGSLVLFERKDKTPITYDEALALYDESSGV